jgi:hypothetical protein
MGMEGTTRKMLVRTGIAEGKKARTSGRDRRAARDGNKDLVLEKYERK